MPEENSANTIDRVQMDPKVACPIVCGKYMRATGFFFEWSEEPYLITASHNAIPTVEANIDTGSINANISSDQYLPNIDVYLRRAEGFDVKHIDIREAATFAPHGLDVLAVAIDFDPAAYGYVVWSEDDVVPAQQSTDTFTVVGYDGVAFPDEGQDMDTYKRNIGRPTNLSVVNLHHVLETVPDYGSIGMGLDEAFSGPDKAYNGLSGAPVLGDGLVGIHSFNAQASRAAVAESGNDYVRLGFTRAERIRKIGSDSPMTR
jgi:hypothetical protein